MSDDTSANENTDAAADEAKIVSPDAAFEGKGAGTINRSKPRRSKAPVILGAMLMAGVAGAVFVVFSRGEESPSSRMVRTPENINTTPAGEQLASSERYRNSLASSNQQGSEEAARTPDQSFLATPDEPTRPIDPPKEPIPVVAPTLPPANERKVEYKDRIVYRDRLVSNVANQMPPQPETDWESIDAMAKRMAGQAKGAAGAWGAGPAKSTIVIEQDLYQAPDGRRTGVQVRAPGSPQTVTTSSSSRNRSQLEVGDYVDEADRQVLRDGRSQRDRQATHSRNPSPVETIPQETSYQADLDTSLPYLSVAPSEDEPRLQVSTGQPYGAGQQVFSGDYYATAGSMTYAVIVNGADTDTPGPVVAKVMRGPLKGSRLIGTFRENDETTAMVVQFDRVVLPDGTNLDASAYAIDPAKGTLAVKSEYDARFLQRYGPQLAGAFLSGLGNTLAQTQTTIVPLGLSGAGIARPKPRIEEGLYAAAGQVGDQFASEIEDLGPDGPIVRLNAGKLIGVLFTENVQRF
ncbi:DotG/IcmE/VirB10 family protein [Aureimonas sp. SK2]|uniref:DotG/IcmE/VirB10 family protein n=1 Tax=Aureimonas sp. SK2 TaxID=3015992 RepID=UPI0024441DC5|nr:DotG/IcmE/VirB10 family protein [Aureimonas sp. SK2]